MASGGPEPTSNSTATEDVGDLEVTAGSGGAVSFDLVERTAEAVIDLTEAFAGVVGRDVPFVDTGAAPLRTTVRSSDAAAAAVVLEPDRWVLTAVALAAAVGIGARRTVRRGA